MSEVAAILLAEDDENDVFFMHRALTQAGLPNKLIVASNGQQAIDYLSGKGAYSDRKKHPLPGLLLLDLKMPLLNGFDVLDWLRKRPDLQKLPVVVLSSSDQDSDVQRARELGAVDYRIKSADAQALADLLKELKARWLNGN